MRIARRAIASLLVITLTVLSGGPVWAQTARITVAAPAGMTAVPVLPQAGASSGFSNALSLSPSLSGMTPLPAPSASPESGISPISPVGASIPRGMLIDRTSVEPAVARPGTPASGPQSSLSALRAMRLPAASKEEDKKSEEQSASDGLAFDGQEALAARAPVAANAAPNGRVSGGLIRSRAAVRPAKTAAPTAAASRDLQTSALGQFKWAGALGPAAAALGFGGYALLTGGVLGAAAPHLAAPLFALAGPVALGALGYATLGGRIAVGMWKRVSALPEGLEEGDDHPQPWRERLGLALRTPIATPQANHAVYDTLAAPAKALINRHEETHRKGWGEFAAYLRQGLGHPAYLAREAVGGVRAFFSLVRRMSMGDADLAHLVKPHRKLFWTSTTLAVFDSLLNPALSFVVAPLLALSGVSVVWGAYSTAILLLFAAYATVELFFNSKSQSLGMISVGGFRTAYVANVIRQPLEFLSRKVNNSKALANRAKLDINYLTNKNVGMRVTLLHLLLYGILGLGSGLAISFYFSLPLMILMPIIAVISVFVGNKISDIGEKQVDLKADLFSHLQGALEQISLIRASGAEDLELERYKKMSAPLIKNERTVLRKTSNFSAVMGMFTALPIQLLYLVGGLVVASHFAGSTITMPMVVALTFAAHFIEYSAQGFTGKYISLREAEGKSTEAHKLILRDPELKDVPNAALVTGPVGIRFENVTFHYDAEDGSGKVKVLDDVSFEAAAGKTIAFVGETGSGKSTIVNMLLRLADVDSGRVLVNGVDIRETDSESLHQALSLVDQDTQLFPGTIGGNMKYANENVTDEQLNEAIRVAKADFVYDAGRFPHGLDTQVAEAGGRLSGGEKQRVAIVRALLRRSPVLILDEATRALDNKSEREVQGALDGMGYKPTKIVVAHRLTTVRGADRINVMKRGKIVESGTHSELLKLEDGVYAKMWQKGGYDNPQQEGQLEDSALEAVEPAQAPQSAVEPAATPAPAAAAAVTAAAEPVSTFSAKFKEFEATFKNFVMGDKVVKPFLPKAKFTLAVVISIVSVAMGLGLGYLLGDFINLATEASKTGFAPYADRLYSLAAGVLGLTVASPWLSRWTGLLVGNLGIDATWNLRNFLYEKILHRDMDFYRKNPSAETASRFAEDLETLISKNLGVRLPLMQNLLTLAVAGGLMAYTSWPLALIVFAALPLLARKGAKVATASEQTAKSYAKKRAVMVKDLQSLFSRLRLVKAFGQEKAETASFAKVVGDLVEDGVVLSVLGAKAWIYQSSLADFFAKYLIYIVGVGLGLPIGTVVMLVIFSGSVRAAYTSLSANWLKFKLAVGETEQVRQWLSEEPEIADLPNARPLAPGPIGIRFERVTFNYNNGEKANNVLTDLSFEAKPGETVAFVGASGSGKSTILSLVERVREPVSGRVLVNGVDLKDVTRKSFTSQMAVVSQEAPVFNDTVENNLRWGAPADLTEEELLIAVRAAAPFLLDKTQFPAGLQSPLGEAGTKVSGGQRQRIAIVRAMLRRPRLLILDEATAALDKSTELEVQAAFAALTSGHADGVKPTVLVVAHNLTTVLHADRILVLENGRIVESGTHRELLPKRGFYAELWAESQKEQLHQ